MNANEYFEKMLSTIVVLLWREVIVERIIIIRDDDVPPSFSNKLMVHFTNDRYAQYIVPNPEYAGMMNANPDDTAAYIVDQIMKFSKQETK